MSAVIVIGDDLRSKVARTLSELSVHHARSIARLIKPEFFDACVEEVCKIVHTDFPDFEAAVIAATGRVLDKIAPQYFIRRAQSPSTRHFARKTKK